MTSNAEVKLGWLYGIPDPILRFIAKVLILTGTKSGFVVYIKMAKKADFLWKIE